ncbi:methyltransferase type 11 [Ectothiorhodospira sp. PHS-1]|uniref:class I SAM-dependent methyltransferase n=1 Tax=Ectothiorhodospira sp. PHS-1 TaxID=519989 RepID=UPI00024A8A0F|nr:class I SAM-dependent methyltransferase [Ectothiorhodospira sp. PHS-1]EHQ53686.1 methyltransferase type 11 [Ectothiorhodospira sp. PHS-1]
MSDWTAGYVADIGYTYGYYAELNPLRLHLAFLNAGLVPPAVGAACELGFGQGLSVNLHAAAGMTHWHGTDFNPSQAGFARKLAQVAGSGANLSDESFVQFCARDDLPDFDYIGLHGIWSWISDENRTVIVDFLRRKLRVGGVLYISYNTQPGWAAMVPMRDLLIEHAEVLGADGAGIVSRIDSALAFADQLLAANPAFVRANPQIAERINRIKEQNRHYLAHEVQPAADVSLKVSGSLGEATLQESVYRPFLEQLADHRPRTLGQLEKALKDTGISFPQVLQAALVLSATGALLPAQEEAVISKARKCTDRLNSHLMMKARGSNDLSHLASPVTGGGISVPRFQQLFLLARCRGHKQPQEWAGFVWEILSLQGQRLVKDGKALEDANANLAELTEQAQVFADQQLPILKALQIA